MMRILNSYRGQAAGRYGTVMDRARRFRWRIRTLYGLFALGFIALAARAADLMVIPSEILEARVQRQHHGVVELSPRRGMIFDRAGEVFAVSVDVGSVVADPWMVRGVGNRDDLAAREEAAAHVREAARRLAPVIAVSELELREKMGRPGRFVWIKRQVSEEEAAAVEALEIPGVLIRQEKKRAYPHRDLAAAILGFVNIEGRGLEGLELAYDSLLSGTSYKYTRVRDGKGRDVSFDGVLLRQSRGGGHLVLTLDLGVQYAAEMGLRRAMMRTKAKGGFVLVTAPDTGEILAYAQQPGFNPNVFSRYDPAVYRNRAATDVFEPGSTMKPFIIAAALEDKLIHADEVFDCELGNYAIGKHVVHDTHPYGALSVRDIVKVSSNIGTAKVGERLGKDRMHEWMRLFGFGQSTGSGFPGEVVGLLRSPKKWGRIGLATNAFGQGVSVTGLQLAAALGSLANGGRLMKPWMIGEVVDEAGHVIEKGAPVEVRRVVSEPVARLLADMMVGVTTIEGTAPLAAIPGYHVAGKTGTAQKVDPTTKRYGKGMYVSSFAGFVPAEDPRLVVVAVLDEPQGLHYYGGLVAGPLFQDVAMASLRTLGVAPTHTPETPPVLLKYLAAAVGVTLPAIPEAETKKGPIPVLEPALERPALEALDVLPEETPVPGAPEVATPDPTEGIDPLADATDESAELPPPGAPPVDAPPAGYTVPDFTGQPMRDVLRAVQGADLQLFVSGNGRVAAQVPRPGAVLKAGGALKLVFTPEPTRVVAMAEDTP